MRSTLTALFTVAVSFGAVWSGACAESMSAKAADSHRPAVEPPGDAGKSGAKPSDKSGGGKKKKKKKKAEKAADSGNKSAKGREKSESGRSGEEKKDSSPPSSGTSAGQADPMVPADAAGGDKAKPSSTAEPTTKSEAVTGAAPMTTGVATSAASGANKDDKGATSAPGAPGAPPVSGSRGPITVADEPIPPSKKPSSPPSTSPSVAASRDAKPADSGSPAPREMPARPAPDGPSPPVDPDEPKKPTAGSPSTSLPAAGRTATPSRPTNPTPTSRPETGTSPSGRSPGAAASSSEHLDATERRYGVISISGTYRDLLEEFGRQAGLTPTGDIPEGTADYAAPENKEMSWDEAFRRIKTAIWQADVLNRRTIVRDGDYLVVLSVNDYWRFMPEEDMFSSVEEFWAANPHDDDLVYVRYVPPGGSVADMDLLRQFIPDYARIAAVEGTNVMGLFAKVSDIKKYLALADRFLVKNADPRVFERIACQHILPSQAVDTIERFMQKPVKNVLRTTTSTARPGTSSPQQKRDEGLTLSFGEEPESIFIPEDDRKEVVAYALPIRIDEFKKFLSSLDVEAGESRRTPVVISVEYSDAAELAKTIESVLAAEEGRVEGSVPAPSNRQGTPATGGRSGSGKPVAGVVILPMADFNQLVVVGSDAGVQRVRELVQMFDQPSRDNQVRVELKYANAADIEGAVLRILGVQKNAKGPASGTASCTADPTANAVWLSGSKREVERMRQIIAQIDAPSADEVKLHTATVKHKQPSFIVGILMNYDSADSGAGPKPAGGPAPRARSAGSGNAKFTPDDENGRIYVLSSNRDWVVYDELIRQLDTDDGSSSFVEIRLSHIDPSEAIERVNQFLGTGGGSGGPGNRGAAPTPGARRLLAGDGAILVYGAGAVELEQIRRVVEVIDKPTDQVDRTFVLQYADPQTIIGIVESMVLGGGSGAAVPGSAPRRPGGRSGGEASVAASATLYALDNRLLVKAAPKVMARIEAVVKEFDVPPVEGTETRVYQFTPGTDVATMAETLDRTLSGLSPASGGGGGEGGAGPGRRGIRPGSGGGVAQFIPQPSSAKLIVIAPKALFGKIDEMVGLLKGEDAAVRAMRHVVLKKAQPKEMAATITSMMRNEQGAGGGGGTGRGRPMPGGGGSSAFFIDEAPGGHAVVMHGTIAELDQAEKWIQELDNAALTGQAVKLYKVNKADPKQLVDLIINVIDIGGKQTGAKAPAPKPAGGKKSESEVNIDDLFGISSDEPSWESTRTYIGKDLYLQADYWERTILVVSSPAKLDEIDNLMAKLDPAEGEGVSPLQVKPEPYTLIYQLSYADPYEAKRALSDFISGMWKDEPALDYNDDEKTLIVKHPESKVIDEVEHIIEVLIDQPRGKSALTQRALQVPLNIPAQNIAERLFLTGKKVNVRMSESANTEVLQDYGVQQIKPVGAPASNGGGSSPKGSESESQNPPGTSSGGSGCVLPTSLSRLVMSDLLAQVTTEEDAPSRGSKRDARKSGKDEEKTDETGKKSRKSARNEKSRKGEKEKGRRSKTDDETENTASGGGVLRDDQEVEQTKEDKNGGRRSGDKSRRRERSEESAVEVESSPAPVMSEPVPVTPAPQPVVSPPSSGGLAGMITDTAPQERVEASRPSSTALSDQSRIRIRGKPPTTPETGESALDKVDVFYDPITNTIQVLGTGEDISEIEKLVADMVKEQPTTKPDIRVYRVKYIDPVLAKDIIEEMFGAGSRNAANLQRQMQQMLQQQQQQRQQQAQAQAAARAAAAAAGGRGGAAGDRGGAPGAGGRPGAVPGGEVEEGGQPNQNQMLLQQMAAQPAEIKVYANARDRTLVFRAPTGLYPAILELLATIDRPQETESEFRTFPLKKLQAEDVEKKLSVFLGLEDKPKSQEERLKEAEATGGVPPRRIVDPVTGTEIIPSQIRISSNPMTNTIIALAPAAALDYIGELIAEWESFEMPERLVEWIPLSNSLATDIAEMLDKHFAEDKTARSATGESRGGKSTTSGGKVVLAPPPSFLPYPRLNVVVVRATEEQMTEVKDVISRLDVAPEGNEYESVEVQCADAGALATQLSQMFSTAGAGAKGKGSGTTEGAKFFAAVDGNILFYSVPNAMKSEVVATIQRIDEQTCMSQDVRIVDVKFGKPSEIAEAVNLAYGSASKTGSKRGAVVGGGRVIVTGHDATHRLFVTAPDEDAFRKVQELVTKLDVPTDLKFQLYPLKNLDARAAVDLMKQLVVQYSGSSRSRGGTDEGFAVEADDTTNSLIVLGGMKTHAFVEMAITQFDSPERAPGVISTMIYQLKRASAEEVARNIMTAYAGSGKKGGGEVRAEANRELNAVIVTAPEKKQNDIKTRFIDTLDALQPPRLESAIIKLTHVPADLMAEKMRGLMAERIEALKGTGVKSGAVGTTIAISADSDLNELLVLADADNLKFIRERVAQLDTEGSSLREGLVSRRYPVKWADPNILKGVIDEWSAARSGKTRSGGGRGGAAVQTSAKDLVQAYVDNATSCLIVTASEENQRRIEQLVAELDQDTGLGTQREIVFLKHANATELQQVIAQGLSRSGGANKRQPGQQLVVTAVPQLNAMIVQGGPKDIDDTKSLIEKLDIPSSEETGIIIKVYPLQYLDPQFVVTMVNQAFAKTSSRTPEDTIRAAWTPPSNLIIGASKENHVKIEALLKQLDVESSAQREVHNIKLTYASAADLAQSFNQIIQNTQAKKRTDVQPMYVTADTGTNSLIVYANEVELKWVKALLAELDVKEVTSGRTITSVQLAYADPQAVSQAITTVFGQASGGKRNPMDQVSAFPEYGSRSVIVASSPRMVEDVKRLIAQLDTAEGGDRPVHTIEIKYVDPEAVQQVLQDLYSGGSNPFGGGRGRGGGFFFGMGQVSGGLVISTVPGTRLLVVRANEEEYKKIAEIVRQVDVSVTGKQDIRIFMLKNIDATEAQQALQNYFAPGAGSKVTSRFSGFFGGGTGEAGGGIRVGVLASSNALVVTADKDAMEAVATVVEQLDGAVQGPNKPRIIKLAHVSVGDVEPTVTELFLNQQRSGGRGSAGQAPPVIVGNEPMNALIVRATDMDFQAIMDIVSELDRPELQNGGTFRIIPIPAGFSVTELAQSVQDAVNRGAQAQTSRSGSSRTASVTVVPNLRTRSLLVTGSPTLFSQVEAIVDQWTKMGPPGGMETRVIPAPRSMSANDLQALIEFLKQQEETSSSGSSLRRR